MELMAPEDRDQHKVGSALLRQFASGEYLLKAGKHKTLLSCLHQWVAKVTAPPAPGGNEAPSGATTDVREP